MHRSPAGTTVHASPVVTNRAGPVTVTTSVRSAGEGLGPEVADMRPVLKGLTIEQNIVVNGAFHLDNERKLAELE